MNRKALLRAALVALPLVAALLYIALNWYRIEQVTVWVQAGEEARRNPFLAYTRLLEHLGAGLQPVPQRVPLAGRRMSVSWRYCPMPGSGLVVSGRTSPIPDSRRIREPDESQARLCVYAHPARLRVRLACGHGRP